MMWWKGSLQVWLARTLNSSAYSTGWLICLFRTGWSGQRNLHYYILLLIRNQGMHTWLGPKLPSLLCFRDPQSMPNWWIHTPHSIESTHTTSCLDSWNPLKILLCCTTFHTKPCHINKAISTFLWMMNGFCSYTFSLWMGIVYPYH